MATLNVHVVKKEAVGRGTQQVTYCDPAAPNTCYIITCGLSDRKVKTAITSHIKQRKAAGLDYPGAPKPPSPTISVMV